jgi:prepilin-type N-terminal cleavage/methylation domain-containing protein
MAVSEYPMFHNQGKKGFSLLELVIVVAILAVIAAIAIPRISRASAGSAESALAGNLKVLRNAIETYAAEHNGQYPGLPLENVLIRYTDDKSVPSNSRTTRFIYGPYLKKMPSLPVGKRKGCTTADAADSNDVGWIYEEATGEIHANTTDDEVDSRGVKYNTY